MTIKLIALDIDDTLLNSDGKILTSTKVALEEALHAGIKIVLCSGRPLPGVQPFLQELNVHGDEQYAITYNGSVIESVTGNIINKLVLSNQTYREIDNYAKQHQLPYYVLDEAGDVYTSNRDVNRIAVIQAWENNAGIFIRTPEELDDNFTIVKAAFVGEVEQLNQAEAAVKQVFGDTHYVVRAASNFLEVMNKAANKGAALNILANELAISPDEVMVFGDEQNDIPMFDFAGQAIAMGNGSDIAKSHATFVTDTNDHDGIANALNKFVF